MPPPKWKTPEIIRMEAVQRFWGKVNKSGPIPDQANPHYAGLGQCWQWIGNVCCNYGRMKFVGRQDKAHRISKQIELGRDLDGKEWVIHKCDNSLCVNPEHLYLGNHKQNVADRDNRGRTPEGEDHPCTKVSDEQLREIQRRYQAGEGPKKLSKEFPLSVSYLSNIGRGVIARKFNT
jgi:hypothetical protein